MKVLNLYAGIGGNRKLWTDVEVTAVEYDERIAKIYQDHFPDDKVIVTDAHQYLLDHFKEFEFIWSSPPCPTHSRMNTMINNNGLNRFPDMRLYEEIIFLKHWFEGKYCVENVISYYEPLIKPIESNGHYFWTNFPIRRYKNQKRNIVTGLDKHNKDTQTQDREKMLGLDLSKFNLTKTLRRKVINNCIEPEVALHILEAARGIIKNNNVNQMQLAL